MNDYDIEYDINGNDNFDSRELCVILRTITGWTTPPVLMRAMDAPEAQFEDDFEVTQEKDKGVALTPTPVILL